MTIIKQISLWEKNKRIFNLAANGLINLIYIIFIFLHYKTTNYNYLKFFKGKGDNVM